MNECFLLLNITKSSHAPKHPKLRSLITAHKNSGDELLVGTARDLVDWTTIETRIFGSGLDGVHVHDGQQHIENFRVWLN